MHVLEPLVYQAASNSADAFPTPKSLGAGRTAFYAQQKNVEDETEGGVFGSSAAPAEAEEKPPMRAQWKKGNGKLPEEKVQLLEPVTNRGHTTFYAQSKDGDIGGTGQISGVPEFMKEDIMYQPLPHMRKDDAYPLNGSAEKGWGADNVAGPTVYSQ